MDDRISVEVLCKLPAGRPIRVDWIQVEGDHRRGILWQYRSGSSDASLVLYEYFDMDTGESLGEATTEVLQDKA